MFIGEVFGDGTKVRVDDIPFFKLSAHSMRFFSDSVQRGVEVELIQKLRDKVIEIVCPSGLLGNLSDRLGPCNHSAHHSKLKEVGDLCQWVLAALRMTGGS